MNYVYTIMPSPVGELKLVASPRGLAGVLWEVDKASRVGHLKEASGRDETRLFTTETQRHRGSSDEGKSCDDPILTETRKQLAEYFEGSRRDFTLPLDFVGSDFNKKVWHALLAIPYGETRTYGQLAKQLGDISLARAVGAANGKNPIAIVAPCHRVIGANGKLTGFAAGLEAKAYLLKLEADKNLKLATTD